MIAGDRVIGVIDLQSSHVGALSGENLPAFEALAGQLAVAIINAELFVETERARQEVAAQTRRLVHEGWAEFLDGLERKEYLGYSFEDNDVHPLEKPLSPVAEEDALVVPVQVSGEPVGTLQFEGDRPWTEDDNILVTAVAQQIAQQIESLRLLAQADQYQAEAQAVLRRLTREGWDAYREQAAIQEMGFIYQDYQVKPLDANGDGHDQALTYPIKVRDEPIGTMGIAGVETLSGSIDQRTTQRPYREPAPFSTNRISALPG
jgi:hypothetical protein